jgi:triosephosphate isomerase (TIM)
MNPIKRGRIITGNWKMNKTHAQALDFIKNLIPQLTNEAVQVFLAVPFTVIYSSSKEAVGTPLVIGAQNMNDASEGAFTGEIAALMLKEAGAQFVILGHSERRYYFHEDDAFINRKIKRALSMQIRPVLCIGETLEERESGRTQEIIDNQLRSCLADIPADTLKNLIVAYEPVWAVGALEGATPEQAQEIHAACRVCLSEILNAEIAQQIVIQYGGTVNSDNAGAFLEQPDIDGLLVGRASLSLQSFIEIINPLNNEDET